MRTVIEIKRMLEEYDAPQFEFTNELRAQIFARQGGVCWLCPPQRPSMAREVAHVAKHRGMGGKRLATNNPINLIGTCTPCHQKHHGTISPWLRFVAYDPDDAENGLIVERSENRSQGPWVEVPKCELAFYSHRPSEEKQNRLFNDYLAQIASITSIGGV